MSRRWDTAPRHAAAETRWTNPMPCGYCRKRTYPNRRAARRALRAHHPDDAMGVYRCRDGGQGFHLGHRDAERGGWPDWFVAAVERRCDRCGAAIQAGGDVAVLHGRWVLCLNCGDRAEQLALAS